MTQDGCQGPIQWEEECRPWAGTPRADDHDAIERLLRQTPEGAPVTWLAQVLFGEGVESGDRDWRLVRRHCEQYHDVFRPTSPVAVQTADGEYENRETEPDFVWVRSAYAASDGVLDTASGISVRDGSVAKGNAEVALSARRELVTAGAWADAVVGPFAGKRSGEGDDGERTRFNDVSRALDGRDRVGTAFDGALAEYNHGVLVTVTTDPGRFESISAAAEELLGDVKRLRKKLGRAVGESVLPGVVVPEPTARGVPHAHVAAFGAEREELPSRHDLHNYWWEGCERGQQVAVTPLVADGGEWTWVGDGPADADGCPPRAYCQQGAKALVATAALDVADVLAVAEGYREFGDAVMDADSVVDVDVAVGDATGVDAGAVRRAAWYFGTGLKVATRPSRSLREVGRTGGISE